MFMANLVQYLCLQLCKGVFHPFGMHRFHRTQSQVQNSFCRNLLLISWILLYGSAYLVGEPVIEGILEEQLEGAIHCNIKWLQLTGAIGRHEDGHKPLFLKAVQHFLKGKEQKQCRPDVHIQGLKKRQAPLHTFTAKKKNYCFVAVHVIPQL